MGLLQSSEHLSFEKLSSEHGKQRVGYVSDAESISVLQLTLGRSRAVALADLDPLGFQTRYLSFANI